MGTPYTKLTNLELTGLLKVAGAITASGGVAGNVTGNLTGGVLGAKTIEKADSYALSAADRAAVFISLKNTGSSKTFTLGLAAGQIALVYNHGTQSVTVKNVADDTETTLATTKLILVVGSATANASTVIELN